MSFYVLGTDGRIKTTAPIIIGGPPFGILEDSVIESDDIIPKYEQFWRRNSVGINYSDGNVGIGTSNPTVNLQVSVLTGAINTYITSGDTTGAVAFWLTNNYPSSPNWGGIGLIQSDNSLRFSTTGSFSNARMIILAGGNVGIGTLTPNALLEVKSPSVNAIAIINAPNGFSAYIRFDDADVAKCYIGRGTVSGTDDLELYAITSQNIRFYAGGTFESARIASTGNVGIGVTVPNATLHIKAGTASANTAPIKLNSGTLLTSPEVGAIEFLTDNLFLTITTGTARKAFVLDDGARLTSGKIPIATTNGRLIDSTASSLITAGTPQTVASIFEKAETGTDANVLTYTTNVITDEYLHVMVSTDVSALTGTSVVVTLTWKDSNNATQTTNVTLSGVADGTINIPINAFKNTNVVVSTVFTGVSTAYNISAFIMRLK